MDYIEKLTGMKVNELLEVSQDREAWRGLVVTCVLIYNRPTREREIAFTSLCRNKFYRI